jgi:S1-C subfamily serine protease
LGDISAFREGINMRYAKAKQKRSAAAVALAAVVALTTVCAAVCEEADQGRDILNRWQSAVVTVKLVTENRMVAQGREMSKTEGKSEVTGTIIDPSGLVLVSLFSVDSSKVFERMAAMSGGAANYKMETQVTDVKIRLPDGEELPAKIVLRDEDLDLAFIRPTEKLAETMPAVDLSDKAEPRLLDPIVVLNRMGKVANWAPAVILDRIYAIVEKPRRFYVPTPNAMEGGLGSPVFALDGKAVGIFVLRVAPSADSGMGSLFGGMSSMGLLPIILPSEDILAVAQQAPETAE